MRARWFLGLLVVALVGLGVWRFTEKNAAAEEAGKSSRDGGPVAVFDGVVAEGVVVPVRYTAMSLPMAGTLKDVLVDEGEKVQEGQLLARIESREAEARLQTARAELQRALANVRQVKAGVRSEELAIKEAQLAQAASEVARSGQELKRFVKLHEAAGGVAEQELERARSTVERAEATHSMVKAEIELMRAGTRPEAVAVAEAGVAAARAMVQQAEATLGLMEIRAPFSGTVAYLELRAGEFAPPGAPVLRIADLSRWVVRTEDLTELAVVRVQSGAQVTLSFDAIPKLDIPGRVSHVRAFGERKRGDMTYTVVIEPEQQDSRLRWNMTASVRISPLPDGGATAAAGVDVQHLAR